MTDTSTASSTTTSSALSASSKVLPCIDGTMALYWTEQAMDELASLNKSDAMGRNLIPDDPVEQCLSQLHLLRDPDTWISRSCKWIGAALIDKTMHAEVSTLFVLDVYLRVWRQILLSHALSDHSDNLDKNARLIQHMRIILWSRLILHGKPHLPNLKPYAKVFTEWVNTSVHTNADKDSSNVNGSSAIQSTTRECLQIKDISLLAPKNVLQTVMHLALLATCPPAETLMSLQILPQAEPKLYLYILLRYMYQVKTIPYKITSGFLSHPKQAKLLSYYIDVTERLALGEIFKLESPIIAPAPEVIPSSLNADPIAVKESCGERGSESSDTSSPDEKTHANIKSCSRPFVKIEIRDGILYVDNVQYRPRDAIDVYSYSDSQWRNAIFQHWNGLQSNGSPSSVYVQYSFQKQASAFIPIDCSGMCSDLAAPGTRATDHGTDRFAFFDVLPNVLLHPDMKRQWYSHVQQIHAMTHDEFRWSACNRDVFFAKTDTKTVAKWNRGIVLLLHGSFWPGNEPHYFEGLFGYLDGAQRQEPFFVYGGQVRQGMIDQTLVANARNYSLDLALPTSMTSLKSEAAKHYTETADAAVYLWPQFLKTNVCDTTDPGTIQWLVDVRDSCNRWCSARLLNWNGLNGEGFSAQDKISVRFLYYVARHDEVITYKEATDRLAMAGTRAMDHAYRQRIISYGCDAYRLQLPNLVQSPFMPQFDIKRLLWRLVNDQKERPIPPLSIPQWIEKCVKKSSWYSITGHESTQSKSLAPSLPVDVRDVVRDDAKSWYPARLVYCPISEELKSSSAQQPFVMLLGYDRMCTNKPYSVSFEIDMKSLSFDLLQTVKSHEFAAAGVNTDARWITDLEHQADEDEESYIDVKEHAEQ